MAYHESHPRTLSKTIVYRIVLIVADSIIVFAVTRRIDYTVGSIGLLAVANTLIYYFYERVWNRIHWGKQKLNKSGKRRKSKRSRG